MSYIKEIETTIMLLKATLARVEYEGLQIILSKTLVALVKEAKEVEKVNTLFSTHQTTEPQDEDTKAIAFAKKLLEA